MLYSIIIMDFLFVFACFGMFILGICFTLVIQWFIKRQAYVIHQSERGKRGQEVKAEMESRLMAFMLEVKTAHDLWKSEGGTDLKEFGLQKMPMIALKYPDVLMKQGKNLMKLLEGEGFDDLEGLLR